MLGYLIVPIVIIFSWNLHNHQRSAERNGQVARDASRLLAKYCNNSNLLRQVEFIQWEKRSYQLKTLWYYTHSQRVIKAAFGRREIFLFSSRNFAEAFGQHISRKKLYLSQMRHKRRR